MKEKNHIDEYFSLVKATAKKYHNFGVPFEDLFQEGLLGILEAEKRFDSKREVKFSTYATYWIKKRILEALERERKESLNAVSLNEDIETTQEIYPSNKDTQNNGRINLPGNFPKIESRILKLSFEEGRTLNEISKILSVSREKARQLKHRAQRRLRINQK
jgi:RNA polymerase sigma factor (sigma-70 family)